MFTFQGIDVVLSERVEPLRLQACLASVLAIPALEIAIIDDVADYPAEPRVVCVTSPVDGEFRELVSIQHAPLQVEVDTLAELMAKLARSLGTSLLFPDEDINPFTVYVVGADGSQRRASLVPDALDRGTYLLG
jgi:hypothetical protein